MKLKRLREKYLEVLKKDRPSDVDRIDFIIDREKYVNKNPDWEKTYCKDFHRIYIDNQKPKNIYTLTSGSKVLTQFKGVEK